MSDLFDVDAYSQFNISAQQLAARTLAQYFDIFNNAKKPAALLDIGCGDGKVTSQLLTCHPSFTQIDAIDISPEMLHKASTLHRHPRIKYFCHDLQTKPLQHQYTVATAFMVLHWIDDVDRFLVNLHASITDGGYFVGATLADWPPYRRVMRDLVNSHCIYRKHASPFAKVNNSLEQPRRWMSADSETIQGRFEQLFYKAGFTDIQCQLDLQETLLTKEELRGTLQFTALKLVHNLPSHLEDQYMNDIFNRVADSGLNIHYIEEHDLFLYNWNVITFCAQK